MNRRFHLLPLAGLLLLPLTAAAQSWPPPPQVHFSASGEFTHSTAIVAVDAWVLDGSTLTATLTSPSGSRETLSMERSGNRSEWTGSLREAGTWRVEVVVDGPNQDRATADASLSLIRGEPTCVVSLSAPETPTHYLEARITVNTCESSAATGEIATRYARVMLNDEEVGAVDASEICERAFILPGDGNYEAVAEVADDRGVTATCSSRDLVVDGDYPGYWLTLDSLGGTQRDSRPDVYDPDSLTSPLVGAGVGITVPRDRRADATTAFSGRAGAGIGTNQWGGSAFDAIVTRQTRGGYFGGGIGLWGLGDPDIIDATIIGTAGINLNRYYQAGASQLFVEVRGFAQELGEVGNNFTAALGFRINFKETHRLSAR